MNNCWFSRLTRRCEFEKTFLSSLELSHRGDVLEQLKKGIIDDSITRIIETVAADTVRLLNQ